MRLRNRTGETVDVRISQHDDRSRDSTTWVVDAMAGRPRRFTDDAKAYVAFHEAMHEAFAEGYMLEHDGVPIAPAPAATFRAFPELEAPIEAENDLTRPADEDALLVLGDAWASAGDPRGDALLGERVLGPGMTDPAEFMRQKKLLGASRAVRDAHVLGSLGADAYRVQAKYQRGLVFAIELHLERGAIGRATAELVSELLANPYARFVRELSINACDPSVVRAIGRSGAPLRKVELFANGSLELAPLDALPRLAHLSVIARELTGFGRFPTLQHVELRAMQMTDKLVDVDAITAWMARHRTLETVLVQPAPATAALETFMRGDAWPDQLRKVTVGQLARAR